MSSLVAEPLSTDAHTRAAGFFSAYRSVLTAAAALVPAAAARAADDAAGVASSRMSYSRFLEYLDMGRVKKVRATP
jgi:cell division protease FtsH